MTRPTAAAQPPSGFGLADLCRTMRAPAWKPGEGLRESYLGKRAVHLLPSPLRGRGVGVRGPFGCDRPPPYRGRVFGRVSMRITRRDWLLRYAEGINHSFRCTEAHHVSPTGTVSLAAA